MSLCVGSIRRLCIVGGNYPADMMSLCGGNSLADMMKLCLVGICICNYEEGVGCKQLEVTVWRPCIVSN